MTSQQPGYQPVPTAVPLDAADAKEAQQLSESVSKEKHTEDNLIAQKLKILIVVTSYFVVSM